MKCWTISPITVKKGKKSLIGSLYEYGGDTSITKYNASKCKL